MPIEFQCTDCSETLAVPDELAGKQARCPSCASVQDVPLVLGNVEQPKRPQSFEPAGNPYAPTSTIDPASSAGIRHGIFNVGDVMNTAFELWRDRLGLMVGATVVVFAASIATSVIGNVLVAIAQSMGIEIQIATQVLVFIIQQLVSAFFTIGMLRICFAAARNQPVEIGQLFSGVDVWIAYFVTTMLFTLAVWIGLLLLIIPGIYVLLTYWPSLLLVADRKAGILESFSKAGAIASGNRLNTLSLGFLSIGISLLGLLACFVGLLFSVPLVNLMFTVAYLTMIGEQPGQRPIQIPQPQHPLA